MMVCSVEYTLSSILLAAANQIFCCVHDLFLVFLDIMVTEKNSMLRHRFIGGCACTETQMGSCASNSTKAGQEYYLKHFTQILSTISTTSNTLLDILIINALPTAFHRAYSEGICPVL